MKAPKFPIYIVTLLFVMGMLISPWMENEFLIATLIILPFFGALLKKQRALVYLIFLPLGGIHHQQFYRLSSSNFTHFTAKGNRENLLVQLTHALKPNDFQFRFYGNVVRVNDQKTAGKILVGIDREALKKNPVAGDLILTQKIPKPLLSRTNPGGFDYRDYLNKIKIYHQLQLSEKDYVLVKNKIRGPGDYLRMWNTTLEKKLDQSQLTTASKNTIKTLLLGKKDALDRELVQAYADAGVIHIFAISGLHIGIIMLFLCFVLKPVQWIPAGKWIYVVCIIGLLWSFAIFTGGSPSVIRAVSMFSGFALAKYSHRIHSTFHLLIVSFFWLLVFYPPFLYQVGFQMSYLAVLGIIKINPLLQKLWQPRYLIIQKLWEITTVCLAAQIAVAPLSIFYFHQFPGLFLLSNWLILPFFGLFLIGSMGIVVLIVLNFEIQALSIGHGKIVTTMNDSILWIAHQEGFLFQNMRLSVSVLVTIYILLGFVYWGIKFPKIKYLMGVVASLLILQIIIFFEQWKNSKINQLWLLYQHDKTLIAHHEPKKLTMYSPQKITEQDRILNDFKNKYPIDSLYIKTFKNTFVTKELQLLVLDEKAVYDIPYFEPSHLLLSNNPKVNLDRVLSHIHPKMVFADGSNPPWNISRWKKTCQKRNITFINLREQGAYPINL